LLSFLASLGVLAGIGSRSQIKAEIRRCLLHAFVFSLGLVGIFGVLLPIASRVSSSDMVFPFFLSLVPFAILCPSGGLSTLLIFVLWALYLGLMTVSLCGVRKAQSKTTRIIGHLAVLAVFGTVYAAGWYLTARAIGEAIAVGLAAAGR